MRIRGMAAALLCVTLVSCGRGRAGQQSPPPAAAAPPPPASPTLARTAPPAGSSMEDVEERRGPFAIGGKTFTVRLLIKRLQGRSDADARALDTLDIQDETGRVVFHEAFPHELDDGQFREWCEADADTLAGTMGSGILVTVDCLPSAPLTGGPWEIFGVVGGHLTRFGKPVVAAGTFGRFMPGAVIRRGTVTEGRADTFSVRVWTGYFFVTVPVRIDWLAGALSLAQRCMTQSGHGFVEDGCEMAPEGAELAPRTEQTFVRLFRESSENSGPPAHVVVDPGSTVEIVGSKVRVRLNEQPEVLALTSDDDVWVQVRIDGRSGWIHSEDLGAIGLFAAG